MKRFYDLNNAPPEPLIATLGGNHLERFRSHLERRVIEPDPPEGVPEWMPDAAGKRFSCLYAEGKGYTNLMRSECVTSVNFLRAVPDHRRMRRVVSGFEDVGVLVTTFFQGVDCVAMRIIVLRARGEVVRVVDHGRTSSLLGGSEINLSLLKEEGSLYVSDSERFAQVLRPSLATEVVTQMRLGAVCDVCGEPMRFQETRVSRRKPCMSFTAQALAPTCTCGQVWLSSAQLRRVAQLFSHFQLLELRDLCVSSWNETMRSIGKEGEAYLHSHGFEPVSIEAIRRGVIKPTALQWRMLVDALEVVLNQEKDPFLSVEITPR